MSKKLSIIITGLVLFAMIGYAENIPQAKASSSAITITSPNGGEMEKYG